MSHFSVAVIANDVNEIEDLLAPYQENNMGDCPKEYMKFYNIESEEREEYEKVAITRIKGPDGMLYGPDDKQFEVENADGETETKFPPGYVKVEVPLKELYKTFEEYMEDYRGYEKDEETGHYGYWENPNARWDWYQLGGRWQGTLLVREDCESYQGSKGLLGASAHEDDSAPKNYKWVDIAKIKDVQWIAMQELKKRERAKCWVELLKESKEHRLLYGITDTMTKEEYVNKNTHFSTYAVITPDGEWCEKATMGWWGMAFNEKDGWDKRYFDNFIRNTDPEYYIAIVDCHI